MYIVLREQEGNLMSKCTNRSWIRRLSILIIAAVSFHQFLLQGMTNVFAQDSETASLRDSMNQSTDEPTLEPTAESTEVTQEPIDQDPDPTSTPSPTPEEAPISPTETFDGNILEPSETPTLTPPPTEEVVELAPMMATGGGELVPDEYIVVLKRKFPAAASLKEIKNQVEADGGRVDRVFTRVLNGYSMKLPPQALEAVRKNPNVKYIEPVQFFNVSEDLFAGTVQSGAVWGLDRIDQRDLPLNNEYFYESSGNGVNVYIVDSGILYSHSEFSGRAFLGFDSFSDGMNGQDCFGHGTHVAGIIGGSTYGVAKGASLISVRAFNCSGSGTTTTVISGLDWIANNHTNPAVVNMSLGGGASPSLDTAVNNLINSGVVVVAAAGNFNADACSYSPGRVGYAITVGATALNDVRSSFSNWGSCLDLFAPGSSIQSAWIGSNSATNTLSGTSASAPFVTGVAALYLQTNPGGTVSQVTNAIVSTSTANKIESAGSGSPNQLLYSLLTSNEPVPVPASPLLESPADDTEFNSPVDSVVFTWQPILYGDSYLIQIANSSSFPNESIVNEASGLLKSSYTFADSESLPGGRFYWRVAAANVNNEYGPWSEMRSFVIVPLPLAPQLSSPDNGAYINISTPELNWLGDVNSITYHLQVSTSSSFSSSYIKQQYQDLTTSSIVLSSLPDKKYFWRVRAANSTGDWGPWSVSRSFTIYTQSLVPRAPVLVSPANGSFTNNPTPELSWTSDLNSTLYHLQVSSSSTFSKSYILFEDEVLSSPETTLQNLTDRKYFWRVKAANSNGDWGSWSSARYFTVDTTPPLAPKLQAPANGSQKIGTPLFEWKKPGGSSFFQFAYNTSGNPEDAMLYTSGLISKDEFKPPELPLMQWLYWFVKAGDKAGNWSDWSTPFSIRITLPKPSVPSLLLPANKTRTNDTTPTLSWNEVNFGVDYHVQISRSSLFLLIIQQEEGLATIFTPSAPLTPDGKYFWRVRARNADGVYGKWSDARFFIVDTLPPPAPLLYSPANWKELASIPTFKWYASSGAKYYQWAYSTSLSNPDNEPFSVVFTSSYTVNTYYKPATMSTLIQYYWFVRAKDVAGNEGTWSGPFAIMILPP
jgi:subtilisin family serine protease